MLMPPDVPNGLVFFPKGTAPRKRRRRTLTVAIVLVAAVALIWPVYPFFGGAFPLILGLPLSLAWVVLWLILVFAALVGLYRSEERSQ